MRLEDEKFGQLAGEAIAQAIYAQVTEEAAEYIADSMHDAEQCTHEATAGAHRAYAQGAFRLWCKLVNGGKTGDSDRLLALLATQTTIGKIA